MAQKNPIIHIGYHKTGTSYIQKNVFENFSSYFERIKQSDIRDTLISPSPLRYSEDSFLDLIDKSKKRVVISNELISSSIHEDDYKSSTNADRLKSAIPDAKVIIGIREQLSMIKSAYSQYLRARGSYSIIQYLKPPMSGSFNFNHLQYHSLIAYYIELFGRENVLILPLEILKKNPRKYLLSIFEFIDEPHLIDEINFDLNKKVNSSLKPCVLHLKKYFNPFILNTFPGIGNTYQSYIALKLFGLVNRTLSKLPTNSWDKKITAQISEVIQKESHERFKKSNQYLNEMTDFDLKTLGYQI